MLLNCVLAVVCTKAGKQNTVVQYNQKTQLVKQLAAAGIVNGTTVKTLRYCCCIGPGKGSLSYSS